MGTHHTAGTHLIQERQYRGPLVSTGGPQGPTRGPLRSTGGHLGVPWIPPEVPWGPLEDSIGAKVDFWQNFDI